MKMLLKFDLYLFLNVKKENAKILILNLKIFKFQIKIL